MANEFKIKKGLIVTGASGGTVVDIQGSQGQLFSVTDDLSGSIFAVSDISGVPILDVNSSGEVNIDGTLIGSSTAYFSGAITTNLSSEGTYFTGGSGAIRQLSITSGTNTSAHALHTFNIASSNGKYEFDVNGTTELSLDSSNAIFAGSLDVNGTGNNTFTGNILIDNAAPVMQANSSNNASGFRINVTGVADSTNNLFRVQRSGTTMIDTRGNGNTTFTAQAFSAATSSGDGSSTLTTKGYVDSLITGATIYRGAWDPSGGGYGSPDLSGVTQTSGYYYICSAAGTAEPNGTGTEPDTWETGDWVIYNDVSGTGQWQKIDNSSVLSGVGTGQTVALWEGAGSVTDSETLGNAPITVSGNDTSFAGDIDLTAGQLELRGDVALDHDGSSLYVKAPSSIFLFPANTNKGNINAAGLLTIAGGGTFGGDITSPTFLGDLNGTINTATTGTTQTAGNNSTLIATTAYADAAAAAVPIGNYLPLVAGSGSPLTGDLYITKNSPILTINDTVASDLKLEIKQSGSTSTFISRGGTSSTGQFNFRITNGTTTTNALFINQQASATFAGAIAVQGTGDSYFTGNVGINETSPTAFLDIQPSSTSRKVTRIANDVMSTYFYNTQADAILAWTCGSYYQAEVVITANQTNGGTTNNLYIRGIWSNNHTSHHWDELEHIGSLAGSTITMSVGQNGTTTNSGRLELDFNYTSQSFAGLNVRVTDFYGTHSYTIT